jgi:hypothetical protein
MLNDRTSGNGRDRPKFQYSSRRPFRIKRGVPHREKSLWESKLQSIETTIGCDKRVGDRHIALPPGAMRTRSRDRQGKNITPEQSFGKLAQRASSGNSIDLMICGFSRQRESDHAAETGPAQHRCSPRGVEQHSAHRAGRDSAKEASLAVRGQPKMTRNTSRTKRAIAMSLKSVACGDSGQN